MAVTKYKREQLENEAVAEAIRDADVLISENTRVDISYLPKGGWA